MRVKISFPEKFCFQTEFIVPISYINYGNHVGNDSIVSIIHEARMRLFRKYNYTELAFEGKGIILVDAMIAYKGQAYHLDKLDIRLAITNITTYGFDILTLVQNEGKDIVHAKNALLCFDYKTNQLSPLPENAKNWLQMLSE